MIIEKQIVMLKFKHIYVKLSIGLLVFMSLSSSKCEQPIVYTKYDPVFMKRVDLENSIAIGSPRSLGTPAKIYTKDKFLFISEAGVGVHVIDNQNLYAPNNIGFIKILGCFDMAIKGNILYADNATDLVTIDLSNPNNINVTGRLVDVFPEPVPPDNLLVRPEHLKQNRPADLVLVKWNKTN